MAAGVANTTQCNPVDVTYSHIALTPAASVRHGCRNIFDMPADGKKTLMRVCRAICSVLGLSLCGGILAHAQKRFRSGERDACRIPEF